MTTTPVPSQHLAFRACLDSDSIQILAVPDSRSTDSLEDAKNELKEAWRNRLERIQRETVQLEALLAEADERYVMPELLADLVHAKFSEFVGMLRMLKNSPGEYQFGPLNVSNKYLHSESDLFVLSLPSHGPVIQMFDAPAMDRILDAFAEVGFGIANNWNGFGLASWSIRVTEQPKAETRYVNMVVLNPEETQTIALTKLKGPSFLIGKTCYPGGKVEKGESAAVAASRELNEETGVQVAANQWRCALFVAGPGYRLTTLAAIADISGAHQREEEPVFLVDLVAEAQNLTAAPYVSDFKDHLTAAKNALQLVTD